MSPPKTDQSRAGKKKYPSLRRESPLLRSIFDLPKLESEILKLEKESTQANFWQDEKKASQKMQELARLKDKVGKFLNIETSLGEIADYVELLALERVEIPKETLEDIAKLERQIEEQELELILSGKYDSNNALLSIYAGAGGVEAQDWANMLLRMYLRYTEKKGFKAEIISISGGEEAGIKSATLEVSGPLAFGYLKGESGVHRLVRLSPFNAQHLRHTSFALVDVIPEIEEEGLEIDPKDLRIDTFRASGAGGQHVNVTDSAVRITHLPTKITTSSQNERSQFQNKENALKVLKSKLVLYQEEKNEEERAKIRGEITPASWGNQIRSYVLHPYNMIKDHRTRLETSDTKGVLDGDIEQFIEAYLRKKK